MFERSVDYCSGAFLMVRRELFEKIGGLDEIYTPGYFEDPDLSIKFSQLGYHTVYLPEVAILHYESATSNGTIDTPAVVTRNHAIFRERHAEWLTEQPRSRADWCAFRSRRADDSAINVLLFPPAEADDDGGRLIRILQRLDAMLTVALPESVGEEQRPSADFPSTCEVIPFRSAAEVDRVIRERPGYFDLALLTRPVSDEIRQILGQRKIRLAELCEEGFRIVA